MLNGNSQWQCPCRLPLCCYAVALCQNMMSNSRCLSLYPVTQIPDTEVHSNLGLKQMVVARLEPSVKISGRQCCSPVVNRDRQ